MRRLLALPLCAGIVAPVGAQTARPIALPQAYELALKRSEALAQDAEAVAEALARVDELKANIMPHLAFVASQTLQQNPRQSLSAINNTSIPSAQLTLTQPLFSGFREFLAFKSARKTAESLKLTKRRAESLLYQDVVQAYVSLLQVQREIEIRRVVVSATEDRISQLERWVRIGRSRESEALAAKSQLAQAQAQVEIARGQERVVQELLRFLTGLDEADFAPQPLAVPALESMEPFLARARERDDVQARRRDLEAADLNLSIARRQRWPTIGLTADYYLKRIGFSSNVHYDAVFGVTLPLFDGGVIAAQTRETRARKNSVAQALTLAQRSAEREVRASYTSLEWSLAAVNALQKAAALAERNLEAQEQDYKLSLITNLQVLDSLSALQGARLQLNSARQQAALARAQLEVAAGGPKP